MHLQKTPKILRILVPSIGGQGGGAITEIVNEAIVIEREKTAREKGVWDKISSRTDLEARYMVPGLAQRSGSVFTSITCISPEETDLPEGEIKFSERVFTGSVDLLIAQEIAEAMRFVKSGYLKKDSVIVANENRVFTTTEKMPSAPPQIRMEDQIAAMKKICKTYIGVDATEVTRRFDLRPVTANSILLGVVSSCKALPVRRESYIDALTMRFSGSVLEENLKSFKLGEKYHEIASMRKEAKIDIIQQSLNAVVERNKGILRERKRGSEAMKYETFVRGKISKYPLNVQNILAEAVGQLLDYEGWHHVALYLQYVNEIMELDERLGDGSFALTQEYAKHFAGRLFKWEGPFEVARLKILKKHDVPNNSIIKIEALLQPNIEEVYGMLPFAIHRALSMIPGWPGFVHKNRYRGWPSVIDVTSLHGFLFFKALSALRFMHKHSVRYASEKEKIEHYTNAVKKRAQRSYDLGVLAASYAQNIKGFAHIREQNFACFDSLLELMDCGASMDEGSENGDYLLAKAAFQRAKAFVTLDGEGIGRIKGLHEKLSKLNENRDYSGAKKLLGL